MALVSSRAWGFIRAGSFGRFGALTSQVGTDGEQSIVTNDIEAGDAAAGVEFCPVVPDQFSSGTLTVWWNGDLSLVGAADGTYSQAYEQWTYTPGDAAPVKRLTSGAEDPVLTVIVGDSTEQHESGGGAALVETTSAGAGTAAEAAAGGSSAIVAVLAAGSGTGTEAASGGGVALVTVTAVGGDTMPSADTMPGGKRIKPRRLRDVSWRDVDDLMPDAEAADDAPVDGDELDCIVALVAIGVL